jgi:alkylation response protein AidB-like acyl-CoA dehydrogenase
MAADAIITAVMLKIVVAIDVVNVGVSVANTDTHRAREGIPTIILLSTSCGRRRLYLVGRTLQDGHITLTDCKVSEANRLANANSLADTARVLRMTRAGIAWESLVRATGAYEHALRSAQTREQFGRPIVKFQLV